MLPNPLTGVVSLSFSRLSRARYKKVRGLLNVSMYALLSVLCIVLNREAAMNVGRLDKALSPTFFNT